MYVTEQQVGDAVAAPDVTDALAEQLNEQLRPVGDAPLEAKKAKPKVTLTTGDNSSTSDLKKLADSPDESTMCHTKCF